MTVQTELQKLHQTSPIVDLFTLDCSEIGGSIYHFTPMFAESGTISFRGIEYLSIPITTEGWEVSSSGTQPRPTLQVSNVHKVLLNAVINLGDIVGARLIRSRTYEKFLDGQPEADPDEYMRSDIYQVEQKLSHTNAQITWQLSSVIERLGSKLPRRQVLKDQTTQKTVAGYTFASNLYAPGISRYRGA